jgi:hypothetical protein
LGATASASFLYDGANVRQSLTYNNRTTVYLQDSLADNEMVLQEIRNGQLYQSDANGNGLWYQADRLDNVRALTNDSGVITGTYSFNFNKVSYNMTNEELDKFNQAVSLAKAGKKQTAYNLLNSLRRDCQVAGVNELVSIFA